MNREEQPEILTALPAPDEGLRFEEILCRQNLGHRENRSGYLVQLAALAAAGGELSLGEVIPRRSTRLSGLTSPGFPPSLLEALVEAEKRLFDSPHRARTGWNEEILADEVEGAGFSLLSRELIPHREQVRLTPQGIRRWLDPAGGGYGAELSILLSPEELAEAARRLEEELGGREMPWERWSLYIHARRE